MADPPPTETAPWPDGLPDDLRAAVDDFVQAERSGGSDDDPEAIGRLLLGWCDGRAADDLDALLDALRERGAYPISLHILEAAWNSDLPPERLGRIAQDWVGTVLHGIGDRAGAIEVAQHLAAGAEDKGPQFAGDLGHMLLEWGLIEAAAPLIEAAAEALPGDMAAQFNLGVVRKLRGDFEGAAGCFRLVLKHHDEQAARWSLGICAVALRDWPTARECWTDIGMTLPEGDGDYAAQGPLVPVKVPAEPGSPAEGEIIWGHRLGPARVVLRGLPRFNPVGYGDVVLVDGVAVAEVMHEGNPTPVVAMLGVFSTTGGVRVALEGPPAGPAVRRVAGRLVKVLQSEGWPAADLTGIDQRPDLYLGVLIPPTRTPAQLEARIRELAGPLPIDLSPLAAVRGVPEDASPEDAPTGAAAEPDAPPALEGPAAPPALPSPDDDPEPGR